MSDQMDTEADCPMGTVSTPRSQTPAPSQENPTSTSSSARLQTFRFQAPERERSAAPSPSKFTAVMKRSHAAAAAPPPEKTANRPGPDEEIRDMLKQVLAENTALQRQISHLSSQVITLSAQVASLPRDRGPDPHINQAAHHNEPQQNPSTKGPPKQNRPTLKTTMSKNQTNPAAGNGTGNRNRTEQAPTPPQSYGEAAQQQPQQHQKEFTLVQNKNKKKANPKPLKPRYDPNDQRVILQIHPDTPPATDVQSTWRYLRLANKAVRHYQQELDYCFVRCHATLKNNLVLQTSLKTCGTDYQPYLEAIKTAFEEEEKLRVTSIDGEARWSKFILHGVPLAASMEDVTMSIQQSYPGILKLAQTPRWLTTETKRQNSSKGMSSVVLAVAGQHTLQSLGYQYLYICNSRCRLAKYLPFGPASQCGKCCRFGHPTAMCRDENPTCGVCGKSHLTRHHTCPAADCKQGGRCTHTPTHCVNCENNLHTSIDPQCPAKAKARQQGQNTDATMEYDTTVDTEPVPPPNHTQNC